MPITFASPSGGAFLYPEENRFRILKFRFENARLLLREACACVVDCEKTGNKASINDPLTYRLIGKLIQDW